MRKRSAAKSMDNYFFKNISIEDESHIFVCKGCSRVANAGKVENAFLFKRQSHSSLYKQNNHLLKVCYCQSMPKDIFKKYTLKSQAQRESQSAAILSELGLIAPKTNFVAFSLFPKLRNGVESMHEMDFIAGYDDLNPKLIYRHPACLNIIRCFGRDLAVMLNAMLCPKDLGLGNVMYNSGDDKLAWIDSDLKQFKSKKALAKLVMHRLSRRVLKYLNQGQADMFWQSFCEKSTLFAEQKELLFYAEN